VLLVRDVDCETILSLVCLVIDKDQDLHGPGRFPCREFYPDELLTPLRNIQDILLER